MVRVFLISLGGLFLLACAGCGKPSVAATEKRERNSSLHRKARAAEQTGDIKEAISLYRNLLIEEPRAFSIHFHLATLLQDYEENYIAAIYHYQQYLILRPESEKNTLANERIRVSEQLLAPQILRKVGNEVQALTPAHLLKENDRLNRAIVQLAGEKSTLAEAKERAEKERATALGETERLRETLNRMRVPETVAQPPAPPPKKTDAQTAIASLPDAAAIKTLRDEAAALAAQGNRASTAPPTPARDTTAEDLLRNVQQRIGEGSTARRTNSPPATPTIQLRSSEKKSPPAPTEVRTHVVQPSETLHRIAEKYYGDSTQWKKIRNANKTRVDPDGRVRAGQVLEIPQ